MLDQQTRKDLDRLFPLSSLTDEEIDDFLARMPFHTSAPETRRLPATPKPAPVFDLPTAPDTLTDIPTLQGIPILSYGEQDSEPAQPNNRVAV